ncbi:hypothetical protein [Nitrosophilus kaiyonis]|uniref:hypothetical protein n=1 Tax=Nitrosophilus kaiyonis TaxID=2930200 RepID=UPI002491F8DB|nr:hypothetical protein [Nitrosophilus kaiyonis]
MDFYKADNINNILGKEIFKNRLNVSNDEVKKVTGLTISELLRAFIFSRKNNFKQELRKWQETKEPMNIEAIFNK